MAGPESDCGISGGLRMGLFSSRSSGWTQLRPVSDSDQLVALECTSSTGLLRHLVRVASGKDDDESERSRRARFVEIRFFVLDGTVCPDSRSGQPE